MAVPMRSASASQEKRSANDMPATSAAIHSTPEPAKPSQCVDSGPSVKPSTPPAWPGRCGSHWYSRVHSSDVLAAISSARPTQKAARGTALGRGGAPLGRAPPAPGVDSQARRPTGTSHQTE